MPEITVIVPVYKAEAFLADCIDSILSQTFSDFEVILVEDGSPDNSGRICDEYAAREPRISVIHQKNQGQAAARNHALAQATGNWICFVDSDDLIHPQMLQLLYDAAQVQNAPIAMCEMLEAIDIPEDFLYPRDPSFSCLTMDEETLVALHDGERYPAWVACAKLIRRELVEHYPFREGRVYEDNEAVCRWVCEGKRLAWTEERLYFYRGNADSTTKSSFSLKRLDYLWALESIITHYTGLGYQQMCQRFVQRYVDAAASCCNSVRYLLKRPELVKQITRQVRGFLRCQKISLTQTQFETLLDAAHPEVMRFYWPISGGITTLRQQGISGVIKKIRKHLGGERL